MTETSRSPYTVIASVLGIGVAVMTRTSGTIPFFRSAARWTTPKRCCSSITTSPRFRKTTPSWIRAWVPMTISISPLSSRAWRSSFFRCLHTAGQKFDLQADYFRPDLQIPVMLFRQDFRWCHYCGLITVLTGGDHRRHGNDRFSGTDISLEQAIHAPDRCHVPFYFCNDPLLGAGQCKRKRFIKSFQHLPARSERNPLFKDARLFFSRPYRVGKKRIHRRSAFCGHPSGSPDRLQSPDWHQENGPDGLLLGSP